MLWSYLRKSLALAVCLAVYYPPSVGAQAKSDKVSFETVDQVKIEGTYYPGNKGNKSPCVLLLHDCEPRKGNNSRTDEWTNLAGKLQDKGYAVLSFDFRGFGQSTSVGPLFWKTPQNITAFPGFAKQPKPPMTITEARFPITYYRQLVNDVAAARAFLDNENDANALNSRNLIVIGAGQGAAVGMMWIDAEFKRHKAQVNPPPVLLPNAQPTLRALDPDPVGDDLAAAIWLSPNPNLGGANLGNSMRSWVADVAGVKGHKLPMVFLYGKNDPTDANCLSYMRAIANDNSLMRKAPIKGMEFTVEQPVNANLTGSKLLHENLDTIDTIIKDRLEPALAKRGTVQWKAKNNDNEYFYWKILPRPELAKSKGDKVPNAMPPSVVGLR